MGKSASIDCSIDVSKIHFTYTMAHAREVFGISEQLNRRGFLGY